MFKTGNVIKLKGSDSIVIVSNVDSKMTNWISFDSSGCSGGTKNKTGTEKTMCWSCDINDGGDIDYDCEDCKGTGEYDKIVYGADKAKFLADNVKEYIIESLTKNFNF